LNTAQMFAYIDHFIYRLSGLSCIICAAKGHSAMLLQHVQYPTTILQHSNEPTIIVWFK